MINPLRRTSMTDGQGSQLRITPIVWSLRSNPCADASTPDSPAGHDETLGGPAGLSELSICHVAARAVRFPPFHVFVCPPALCISGFAIPLSTALTGVDDSASPASTGRRLDESRHRSRPICPSMAHHIIPPWSLTGPMLLPCPCIPPRQPASRQSAVCGVHHRPNRPVRAR